MQIIFETSDYTEALIKKGMLEQAGFSVHMDNENAGSAMPYLSMALGNRLWVPDGEAAQAKQLVSDQTLPDDLPQQGDAIDECPECGSGQVVRYRSILWLPVFAVLNVFMAPVGGRHRTCLDCGCKYKARHAQIGWPMRALMLVAIAYVLSIAFVWFSN